MYQDPVVFASHIQAVFLPQKQVIIDRNQSRPPPRLKAVQPKLLGPVLVSLASLAKLVATSFAGISLCII